MATSRACDASPTRGLRLSLLVALALVLAPLVGEAQPAGKVWRIGFLGTTSPKSHGAFVDAFRAGLRERGYVEGKHLSHRLPLGRE